jgi:cytochrome c biogenesis protein CcmG/thiol:disulfide interchange protein DsbE
MTRRKSTRTQSRVKPKPRAKARGRGSRRVGPAILALGGALVVAAIIAIIATGGNNDDQQTASAARVTLTGQALPAFAERDDPAVGLPAPTLRGEDFGGRTVTIGDDGRPKAVIFLAHWCPHCQREVPLIQDWLDAQGVPQGVDLYSVATSIDASQPNYPPDAWLEREGWTVPVLVDDFKNSAATAYGLTAFPYFVFVDAEGNVVGRATGELTIEQLNGHLVETAN